jgi:hypothetical protein
MRILLAAIAVCLTASSAFAQHVIRGNIPSQGLLLCSGGVAVNSNTGITTEQNLTSCRIPGGIMGLNGAVRIVATWTFPGNTNSKFLIARLGTAQAGLTGMTIWNANQFTAANTGAVLFGQATNSNSASTQVGTPTNGLFGAGATTNTVGAINTAVDAWINFNVTAASADQIILKQWSVEIVSNGQ